MSINKIIDVWDENGYMMESCLAYEEAYEKVGYYQNALEVLKALDGSITLKSSVVSNLSKEIRELMATSKQAIDDKSERLRTLEQQRKNLADAREVK